MKKHNIVAAAVLSLFAAAALSAPVRAQHPAPKPIAILGGPGTTTPQYIMDLDSASGVLKNLDQDSRTLYGNQATLIGRIHTLKTVMKTTADGLAVINTLDADLKKLEASMTTVYKAADTAEAIPAAREKAKKLKASMAAPMANVTAARKRMDAIVLKTKPIQVKLAAAADKAAKMETALTLVNEGPIGKMRFPISIAAGCVKKIDAARQDCAAKNINSMGSDVDAVVAEYNRVVLLLLTSPQPWLPSVNFVDPFQANLAALNKLRSDIEAMEKRISTLAKELGKLNAVLKQSFGFSFPYLNPTWDNPVRISHCHVDIGFKTIIQGAKRIEDAIEDSVGKTLYKVLKTLGVNKYVNELKDQAEHAANTLLRAVHFDVDMNMPDLAALDQLEKLETGLEAKLDALKFPEIALDTPSFGFPEVKLGIDFRKIKASFAFFNPGGLELNAPNVCNGATYGCS